MISVKPHEGAWSAGKDLASSVGRHVRAWRALLAVEVKDAARLAGVVAGLGAAAAISLVVAYLFFAVTIGFTIAWLCEAIGGVWVLVMLGTGLAHVLLAVMFGLWLKRRLKTPVFPQTREELKKEFA
jgi:hypothetical protein